MKKLIKTFSIILIFIMGINVFSGCEETTQQNIIYETVTPITTLDPQTLSGETDMQVAYSVYGTLMRFDNGGNVITDLASDYSISKDNKTYTFTLSDNAVWSNGEKVTADDFMFAFRRAVLKETNAPYAHTLAPILNATKILKGKKSAESLGVKAIDDKTLQIKLSYPCVDFLQILTTPITMPCKQDFFYGTKGYYGLNDEAVLTCGKYTLSTWNENYCKIKNDTNSTYFYFDDEEKYLESFKKGQVDVAKPSYSLIKKIEELEYKGNFYHITDTANFLSINPSSSFNNEKIIKALMSVATYVPSEEIANTYGVFTQNSIFPQSILDTQNIVTTDDANKHKKAAEELFLEGCEEFDDDFTFPALNFIYVDEPVSYDAAITIAGIWQNKFGISVNIEAVDSLNTLNYRVSEKYFDIAIIPVTAELPSSHSYVEKFSNSNLFEIFDIDTYQLETEAKKLHKSTTEKQLSKISKIICDSIYLKPLYQSSKVFFASDETTVSFNSYSKRIEFENTTKK